MTACPKCGYHAEAAVLRSWTLEIPREVESANSYTVNAGKTRWKYAAQRDAWTRDMLAMRRVHGMTVAVGMRRVTLTRLYSGRQREMDRANFIAGAKPVLDAMVRACMLVDDKPKWLEDHYAQVKADRPGLRVLVEEIG